MRTNCKNHIFTFLKKTNFVAIGSFEVRGLRCAELKQDLFSLLAENGAELMGVADLSDIISGEMQTGIAVAVSVPVNIVKDLQTAPTKEYYDA